jgi:ribonuclease BN (tRNA processing enzyme)
MEEKVSMSFLGTGSAFAPDRLWNGLLLDGRILLDAPPTAMPQLKALGVDFNSIEGAFITHQHGDHFLGLPFIFLEYRMRVRREDAFRVVCSEGLPDVLKRLDAMSYPGMAEKYAERLQVEYIEVGDGDMGNLGDVAFRVFRMNHGDRLALGYVLETEGRRIGYSGDTGPCDGLDLLVSESDVAVVEMAMTDEEYPGHMNLTRILELRERHPDAELWVTHLDKITQDDLDKLKAAGISVPEDLGKYMV